MDERSEHSLGSRQSDQLIYFDISTTAEIENGESIIGYKYLHGTDANAGGFQITGFVGKDDNGNALYNTELIPFSP